MSDLKNSLTADEALDIDVEEAPGPTEAQRRRVVDLCRRQTEQLLRVERLERDLKVARDALLQTQERDLPDAMMEAGILKEMLASGISVELKTSYHPKQLTDQTGLDWIVAHGAGAMIKHDIGMQFGLRQEKLVRTILKRIAGWKSASNFKLTEKRAVNAQTLGAFVREQVKDGASVPFDVLGVYVRRYAEVTIPEQD